MTRELNLEGLPPRKLATVYMYTINTSSLCEMYVNGKHFTLLLLHVSPNKQSVPLSPILLLQHTVTATTSTKTFVAINF